MTPFPHSWRQLERQLDLSDLPAFHRTFLAWRGIDAEAMPLRRVQQRVEAELNRLVAEGQAVRDGDDWRLRPEALAGFLEARTGKGA